MTQFTLWGNYTSKPQAHSLFSANTMQHTGINTVLLPDWTTDYTSEMEAVMITIRVHLRREAFSCATSVTPSSHHPAAPDRCRELRFSGTSAGASDRKSRPLIPDTIPCRLRRRLPFVSSLLLTSTSYVPCGLLGQLSWRTQAPPHTMPY